MSDNLCAAAVLKDIQVRALTPQEDITPMGRLLSKMPTDVHLGKFLLIASIFRCLDAALTIAATLSSKSPFVVPFGKEDEANRQKMSFRTGQLSVNRPSRTELIAWRRKFRLPDYSQRLLIVAQGCPERRICSTEPLPKGFPELSGTCYTCLGLPQRAQAVIRISNK